ncbi:MAG: AbrB/MazE/SpoVT family DNA-binding domain-containing protein [Clostridia bacterium]|nr:AbrB/MazE/SpoVT family DNA-binding domain-containing protein [Clostridia bacterium]
MKATGIVRRIDDLGRVVIPKEIRRTMRIREGDPLEIFTETNGEVIFKKYSPVGEISSFAAGYADVMSRACGIPVIICDRDHVVSSGGLPKAELRDHRLSPALEDLMESRQPYIAPKGGAILAPIEGSERRITVCAPIVTNGDVIGAVCLLQSDEKSPPPTEGDIRLVQVAASFLGKQMDD